MDWWLSREWGYDLKIYYKVKGKLGMWFDDRGWVVVVVVVVVDDFFVFFDFFVECVFVICEY